MAWNLRFDTRVGWIWNSLLNFWGIFFIVIFVTSTAIPHNGNFESIFIKINENLVLLDLFGFLNCSLRASSNMNNHHIRFWWFCSLSKIVLCTYQFVVQVQWFQSEWLTATCLFLRLMPIWKFLFEKGIWLHKYHQFNYKKWWNIDISAENKKIPLPDLTMMYAKIIRQERLEITKHTL